MSRSRPILTRSPRRSTASRAARYIGAGGAGHYVKMVHNGIEYADMQLIAEAYDLMRTALGLDGRRAAEVFAEWNEGELESFLIEITAACSPSRTPTPAGHWSTSSSTRPSRRAPAAGPPGRAGARRAAHRHRPRPSSPAPVRSQGQRARGAVEAARPDPRHVGTSPTRSSWSTTSGGALRLEDRRLRARLRPAAAASRTSTTGTSTSAASRPSGGAAASSGPASSTASRNPTTDTQEWTACC